MARRPDRKILIGDSEVKPPRAGGKYDPSHNEFVYHMRLLGATHDQVATALGIHPATVKQWILLHPEFAKAMENGGDIADAKVAHALYKRAVGYTKLLQKANGVEEVHYPPDARACFQWLACRRRGKDLDIWKLKEAETPEEKEVPKLDDMEVARKLAFILSRAVHGETIDAPAIEKQGE